MSSLPTESVEDFSSALFTDFLVSPHSSESVGRLQMANDFVHTPVLAREILEFFAGLAPGVVVDATVGGGGHAALILESQPQLSILGIDRDPAARAAASEKLATFSPRFRLVDGDFGSVTSIVAREAPFVAQRPIVGVLADLGVSSPQLDAPERGFSFRFDAPLDMRMDPTRGHTAYDVIQTLDEQSLRRLLYQHGETRFAGSIARSIKQNLPGTTFELVASIEQAVPPAARRRGHVATRVFQALRVEVNAEEEQLAQFVSRAIDLLSPGGVLAVIAYHSGEDRVVKTLLHEAATGGCKCPTDLGCVCGATSIVRVAKASAILPKADEVVANPRSRSARLRVAWKLDA